MDVFGHITVQDVDWDENDPPRFHVTLYHVVTNDTYFREQDEIRRMVYDAKDHVNYEIHDSEQDQLRCRRQRYQEGIQCPDLEEYFDDYAESFVQYLNRIFIDAQVGGTRSGTAKSKHVKAIKSLKAKQRRHRFAMETTKFDLIRSRVHQDCSQPMANFMKSRDYYQENTHEELRLIKCQNSMYRASPRDLVAVSKNQDPLRRTELHVYLEPMKFKKDLYFKVIANVYKCFWEQSMSFNITFSVPEYKDGILIRDKVIIRWYQIIGQGDVWKIIRHRKRLPSGVLVGNITEQSMDNCAEFFITYVERLLVLG